MQNEIVIHVKFYLTARSSLHAFGIVPEALSLRYVSIRHEAEMMISAI
ncbi:MAG: hypothetical protein ACSLEM_01270 [Candidatus Malihini olakiniferum]